MPLSTVPVPCQWHRGPADPSRARAIVGLAQHLRVQNDAFTGRTISSTVQWRESFGLRAAMNRRVPSSRIGFDVYARDMQRNPGTFFSSRVKLEVAAHREPACRSSRQGENNHKTKGGAARHPQGSPKAVARRPLRPTSHRLSPAPVTLPAPRAGPRRATPATPPRGAPRGTCPGRAPPRGQTARRPHRWWWWRRQRQQQ